MAAPTQYYVDPAIAADSGTGTSGDPYGDVQYALNQITQGTGGDQINIKAGTDELLSTSLVLTTYGTPTGTGKPLIFRGYTTAANDGGSGGIDMQGNNSEILTNSGTGIHWIDMHLHSTGSAIVLRTCTNYGSIQQCEIDNSTGGGILIDDRCFAIGNYIHNCSGTGIDATDRGSGIHFNYLANGTNDFTQAIALRSDGCSAINNIISIDGTSDGILGASAAYANIIRNNSILSAGGSGQGIMAVGNDKLNMVVLSNLVEGFSASGGIGFSFSSGTWMAGMIGHNAAYQNLDDYDIDARFANIIDAGEVLGASPFAKSGSDTFANRFTYFAPVDTGNVRAGAYPSGCNIDKGAVQHVDSGGGGGVTIPNTRRNSMIGR